MRNEKIAVIIPVYNNTDITKALESIKSQKGCYEFEVIVVDDGSKDNTCDVIENYIKLNKGLNIKLIKQSNAGPAKARNNGMKHAKSDYIAFLDSDDEWHPEKTSKQMKIFNDDDKVMLLTGNINGIIIKNLKNVHEIKFDELLYKNYINTSTTIIKKEILDKVGFFDSKLKYSEDYQYWLRICKEHKCILLNESLVIYGGGKRSFGHSGLSSKLWAMEKSELKNYKYLLSNKYINTTTYIKCSIYSFIKFIRRIVLTGISK